MAITLQTIKDRLERRLKDINDVSDALIYDMATDLNQLLYREMFTKDPERFITTTTFTVSAAPTTSALPAGFRDIQEFGCGFFVRDTSGLDTESKLRMTGFGSREPGYYISGTNVVFTGYASATTIVLRYIPVLADLTTMAGTFVVPDEQKDLLTEGMTLAYYKNEEDPREGESDQRFSRLLQDFLGRLKKSPNIIMFTRSPNSGS